MIHSSASSQMNKEIVILISSKVSEDSSRCYNTSRISKLASLSKNTLRTHTSYRILTTRICSCISCSQVNPTWNLLWGTTAISCMISTVECLNISKREWRKSSKHNSHHAPTHWICFSLGLIIKSCMTMRNQRNLSIKSISLKKNGKTAHLRRVLDI